MAHLLCHLEFLTVNINSGRASCEDASLLIGPIQEIQVSRIGGGLVRLNLQRAGGCCSPSTETRGHEEESRSELSLGSWCEYLQESGLHGWHEL